MIAKPKPGSKASQCLYENFAWIRLIEFLNQENAYMKNRLSEVIDRIQDSEQLAMAEHFQNQFIIKDDVYDHMLHDLNKQSAKWNHLTAGNSTISELKKNHRHIRHQMESIEREHALIMRDYNTYLSSLDY